MQDDLVGKRVPLQVAYKDDLLMLPEGYRQRTWSLSISYSSKLHHLPWLTFRRTKS
jgi:hypothetical protein